MKKIARYIGPEYLVIRLMCESLKLPDYTVKRFLYKSVTREYLLWNFGKLEHSIKYVLDRCSDKSLVDELDPEPVRGKRKHIEEDFLNELRELHENAMDRYLKR